MSTAEHDYPELLPLHEQPRVHAQRIIDRLRDANHVCKRSQGRGLTKAEGTAVLEGGLKDTPPSMHEWVSDYVRSHFQMAVARRKR